ncbi:Hypothetical protein AJAP_42960 (plasmid) [Amycolatopsis japonica]|uniref:Uncharacterized protein n=2 Tax=Amycolatopsis japonica TaxID=208439 RepID=A0A075V790_9PSEU|nr:Hypothetical protein AJAP_42960 [Amycolatopsis japonica]
MDEYRIHMRPRIGIRKHLNLRHAYLDAQLKKLEKREITQIDPLCHANPAYAGVPHVYDMVNRWPFEHLGGEFTACLGCRSWVECHPHILVFRDILIICDKDNDVTGVRGDLPRPRQSRERVGGQYMLAIP